MEIFNTEKYYILWNGFTSLWCDKVDGKFTIKDNINPPDESDLECMGIIYGIIGKIQPIKNKRFGAIIVIAEQTNLGCPYQHQSVFSIDRIAILPFNKELIIGTESINVSTNSLDNIYNLMPCIKHKINNEKDSNEHQLSNQKSISLSPTAPLQKTWTSIKAVAENAMPKQTNYFANLLDPDNNDEYKLTSRIYEEIDKLFNTTESFYYSRHLDLTNSVQRNAFYYIQKDNSYYKQPRDPFDIMVDSLEYDWQMCDDKFFWNLEIIKDILNIKVGKEIIRQWIIPIIQGYVHIKIYEPNDFTAWTSNPNKHPNNTATTDSETINPLKSDLNLLGAFNKLTRSKPHWMSSIGTAPQALTVLGDLTITLISRRSRYRTGTRYNKRGIDAEGHVANYVETEQVVSIANHIVSFVLVRGSIPLYWSQGGMKYRPPPTLEKSEEETFHAFSKHFDGQIAKYQNVIIVNLAGQRGREKGLSDAYLLNVLKYDSPHLTYVSFDFHEYCQAMRYENVSVLTESVADIIKHMQYCWLDSAGFICHQQGVFRINCVDCLDRTNMVQMALAKIILEIQLRKMGLLAPESEFPPALLQAFHFAWANNGDALSLQYAGTAALKGDFTRTGQKKLTSLFKDGYNSATRYYMNQFRDAYRQLAYQVLQGQLLRVDCLEQLMPQHRQLATFLISTSQPLTSFFKNITLPTNSFPDPVEMSVHVETSQHDDSIIEYCQSAIPTENELRYGAWRLQILKPSTPIPASNTRDHECIPCVLILTQQAYYLTYFEGEGSSFTIKDIDRIPLNDLYSVHYGILNESLNLSSYGRDMLLISYNYNGAHGYHSALLNPSSNDLSGGVAVDNTKIAFQCFKAVVELMNLTQRVAIKHEPISGTDLSSVYSSRGKGEHQHKTIPYRLSNGFTSDFGEIKNFGKTATSMLRRATRDAITAMSALGPDVNNRLTKAKDDLPLWYKKKKSLDVRPRVKISSRPSTVPHEGIHPVVDDWREVLCAGIDDDLKISLTAQPATSSGSSNPREEFAEKLIVDNIKSAVPNKSGQDAPNSHHLMKLKLKSRSRILEL